MFVSVVGFFTIANCFEMVSAYPITMHKVPLRGGVGVASRKGEQPFELGV